MRRSANFLSLSSLEQEVGVTRPFVSHAIGEELVGGLVLLRSSDLLQLDWAHLLHWILRTKVVREWTKGDKLTTCTDVAGKSEEGGGPGK